jgi:hypothetical protein
LVAEEEEEEEEEGAQQDEAGDGEGAEAGEDRFDGGDGDDDELDGGTVYESVTGSATPVTADAAAVAGAV